MRPVALFRDRWVALVFVVAVGLALGGCGSLSGALRAEVTLPEAAPASLPADPPAATVPDVSVQATPAEEPVADEAVQPPYAVVLEQPAAEDAAADAGAAEAVEPAAAPSMVAQAAAAAEPPDEVTDQYDPWEPFNEKMFDFNWKLDRYVLKPVARVYRVVMPEPFQVLISNGFSNIRVVPRFVNNLLQGKFEGAGREAARFLINSTAGIGGLFDPAKDYWGIRPSKEDFGQTLGVWGAGPGPYLVLPLLPPLTVRDGIGRGVDSLIDPLGYFIPFIWDRLGMYVGDAINERSLNYDLFEGVEETTLDLYSSVRHFYLKRREQQIKE